MSGRTGLTWALAAGVVLGVAYTLSPLTVLCLAFLLVVIPLAGRDLQGRERRWFFALLSVAVVLRLAVIAAMFLLTDADRPFGTMFGDEEIFKSRTIWLRNVGLGVPISGADVIYAFDETGFSGHLLVLAYLQALVGDAPYGLHIFNASIYIAGTLLLYRLARGSYGREASMGGLAVLLFLPSLFAWSISALKEPIYTLVAVAELLCVLAVVRAPRWWQRLLGALAFAPLVIAMESLRKGTMIVAAIGTIVGVLAGVTLPRPRLAVAAGLATAIALAAALSMPAVQERLLRVARDSVRYHAGHVVTAGISYKAVDFRYYFDWPAIQRIGPREAVVYTLRSAASYFLEPLPNNTESRTLWAYLPEHFLWLIMMALVPIGAVAALKRDTLLTTVLLAHACAVIMMVALTSGNIGTLIRHRGLSLPYLIWLSVLGAVTVLVRLTPPARVPDPPMAR